MKRASTYSYTELIRFSIPSAAATLVEPAAEIIDSALVGHLGDVYLSSLSSANAVFAVSFWVFNFLVHVASAEVASYFGSGDKAKLDGSIRLGFFLSCLFGGCAAGFLLLTPSWWFQSLMDLDPQRLELTSQYYHVRCFSLPFILLISSLSGVLRGYKRVRTSFALLASFTLLNAVSTYLAVYVWDFKLAGAAYGTVFSSVVVALLGWMFFLKKESVSLQTSKLSLLFRGQQIRSYLSHSANQFGRTAAISATFFIAAAWSNRTGSVVGSAHQISVHFWLVASYLLDGFSVTAVALGAGLWNRKQTAEFFTLSRKLLLLSVVVGFIFCSVFLAVPGLVTIFTSSHQTILEVRSVWWLIAVMQIPNSAAYTLDGIFFAMKNFRDIRKKTWRALFLGFLPVFLILGPDTLIQAWIAISTFNLLRLCLLALHLYQLKNSASTATTTS